MCVCVYIYCSSSKWSASSRLATCRRITKLKNGLIVGKGYRKGDELQFQCKKDYVLIGQQRTFCQYNGRWSAREPVCKGMQIIASSSRRCL